MMRITSAAMESGKMVAKQCPVCGSYMIPSLFTTDQVFYHCLCGYNTENLIRSITYTDHLEYNQSLEDLIKDIQITK